MLEQLEYPVGFNQKHISTVHKAARVCNLAQVIFTESDPKSGQPLISKHAYVWESRIVTVVHMFARHGCIEGLNYYLSKGYDPDMIHKIKIYIEKIDPQEGRVYNHEWMDVSDVTPLMYAIMWNQPESIAVLIASGADLNSRSLYREWTPLMYAARYNLPTVATTLLEKGADYNLLSLNDKTARQIAVDFSNTDVVGAIDDYIASLTP